MHYLTTLRFQGGTFKILDAHIRKITGGEWSDKPAIDPHSIIAHSGCADGATHVFTEAGYGLAETGDIEASLEFVHPHSYHGLTYYFQFALYPGYPVPDWRYLTEFRIEPCNSPRAFILDLPARKKIAATKRSWPTDVSEETDGIDSVDFFFPGSQ